MGLKVSCGTKYLDNVQLKGSKRHEENNFSEAISKIAKGDPSKDCK